MLNLISVKHKIIDALKGIYHLLYPHLCLACLQETVSKGDNNFCVHCLAEMPYTDHLDRSDNELFMHFVGRIPLDYGAALILFREGGMVQQLMHNFKYRGMVEIGEQLGSMAGRKILESKQYKEVNVIIPVPMHLKKKLQRGFNQTEIIARSLGKEINVPVVYDAVKKEVSTTSQTRKSRAQRIDNVKEVFKVEQIDKIKGQHIMLVDDVVTTGATLEACAATLIKAGAAKISIYALALAV